VPKLWLGKRGQVQLARTSLARNTLRAVSANWTCPIFSEPFSHGRFALTSASAFCNQLATALTPTLRLFTATGTTQRVWPLFEAVIHTTWLGGLQPAIRSLVC